MISYDMESVTEKRRNNTPEVRLNRAGKGAA